MNYYQDNTSKKQFGEYKIVDGCIPVGVSTVGEGKIGTGLRLNIGSDCMVNLQPAFGIGVLRVFTDTATKELFVIPDLCFQIILKR